MTQGGLVLEGLTVAYRSDAGSRVEAVRGVSLRVPPGAVVGLTGESGCGKSSLALACLAATTQHGELSGRVRLDGQNLLDLPPEELGRLWGRRVAYLAQNPASSLNPVLRIRTMFAAVLKRHLGLRGRAADDHAAELLRAVGISDPRHALNRRPYEFSGGQRQRIALALALSCQPGLLVLDEPTAGLDHRTRGLILDVLAARVRDWSMAVLHVSHDLAALRDSTDRLVVMYAGEFVEEGATAAVLQAPRHPYTRALLDALPSATHPHHLQALAGLPPSTAPDSACAFEPRCREAIQECSTRRPELVTVSPSHTARCLRLHQLPPFESTPRSVHPESRKRADVLSALELSHRYPHESANSLEDVTFSVGEAEICGVVGASGSGKSTLLRLLSGLLAPHRGTIHLRQERLAARVSHRTKAQHRAIQMVFQDPGASLNPHHQVGEILARPLRLLRDGLTRDDEEDVALELLGDVGLSADTLRRRPGQLSGGQQQRVAIARAFAARPTVLLCDEITASLDASFQAGIIDLLLALAAAHDTAVVFVSHDLPLVRAFCTRTMLLHAGRVVDDGPTDEVVGRAYDTAALVTLEESAL